MSQVAVQQQDFDVSAVYADLRAAHGADAGALVTFVGLVRDRNAKAGSGEAVSTLTLEHYPGMTERSIEAIVQQAESRWPLLDVRVVHRVGTLEPGDQIVLVAVASAHRDAAFEAASFVMDYLKTDAVFWKKETTGTETRWIESTDSDHARSQDWRG